MKSQRNRNRWDLSASSIDVKKPGSANLDWKNLGFEYRETNGHLESNFANGVWGDTEIVQDPYLKVHIGATSLHYGQACFEGLKAFHCKDGKVRLFRPDENAKRCEQSATRICMAPFPQDRFIDMCKEAVRNNIEYVPPYGSNGALYIRPLLFGSGARIGLQPADKYKFLILTIPVGDYYQGGIKAVKAVVIDDYDRAAPKGVGNVKVAGNYAADILPNTLAKKRGFPIALYLDAKTNTYVEEFSTSNFLGVDKQGAYITPDSTAALKSITNKSLMELAKSMGMDVQVRRVHINEVEQFQETAACGTAVVLTPVASITYKEKVLQTNSGYDGVGPVLRNLYDRVRAIQTGDAEDTFGWMVEV
eukprot:CAMPEP_0182426340 /NCGR_PEP_ID=MMETSP1167-20130531/12818_1 /TAXON_ID=2988 /ORGANISM="Mallomonas Sp, Strain CCMP3275" /LENGTH=361 /DNA_ID=CAMNT_0024607689 /DNA_START=183 /DNA_END=1268 /DNA_ORIENTATION=-